MTVPLHHLDLGPSPSSTPRLRLSEVVGALSYALDMTEGQPPGHCLRACWIGMHLGRALGLDAPGLSDLYYALLLKDSGCSSNASRLWQLYGGDDLAVKRAVRSVDTQSLFELAQFVLQYARPGDTLRARIHRLLELTRYGDAIANELIETRCERGAEIARRLGFGEAVAAGIRALDEHWNGKGRPDGLSGEAVPLIARIALFAQVVDVFHTIGGPEAARREIARRVGRWFDPAVAAAFAASETTPGFWAGLAEEGLDARVAALEPAARVILIDDDNLDIIAETFADVVDAKSSFTSGHGKRVARYSDAVAAQLGLSPARRRWLRRGALLHDVGKLGISNGILDKPARLDSSEWAAVKRHAGFSEDILRRISVFLELAPIVGAHHERLDGSGYPRRLAGDAIPLETRIITTCDIFDAVTAARPYRGPVPVGETLAMMEREEGTAIDGRCLEALKSCLPQLSAITEEASAAYPSRPGMVTALRPFSRFA